MRPTDLQLSNYRFWASFGCATNIVGQLGQYGLVGLPYLIGLVLLGYIASRWLRQNMHLYHWVWLSVGVVAFVNMFLQGDVSEWVSRWSGALWIMLLLATLPPSSGKRRRQLAENLKKVTRRWSVGIPISA